MSKNKELLLFAGIMILLAICSYLIVALIYALGCWCFMADFSVSTSGMAWLFILLIGRIWKK